MAFEWPVTALHSYRVSCQHSVSSKDDSEHTDNLEISQCSFFSVLGRKTHTENTSQHNTPQHNMVRNVIFHYCNAATNRNWEGSDNPPFVRVGKSMISLRILPVNLLGTQRFRN